MTAAVARAAERVFANTPIIRIFAADHYGEILRRGGAA